MKMVIISEIRKLEECGVVVDLISMELFSLVVCGSV